MVPSPLLLARHFFAVALYAIWTLFTHPRIPRTSGPSLGHEQDAKKIEARRPRFDEYPALMVKSVTVVSCDAFRYWDWSAFALSIHVFVSFVSLRITDLGVRSLVLDSLCCVWAASVE